MLYSAGKASTLQEGNEKLKETLNNGEAITKFCDMMKAQGVKADVAERLCQKGCDVFEILPKSKYSTELKVTKSGIYLHIINVSNSVYI